MAFFPHHIFHNNNNGGSFQPLFRLLDDFDSYSRQGGAAHPCGSQATARRVSVPTWTPKFDIRETGETYELHGELPGVSKDDVHIEFTEHQAMVIRGRVERSYTAGTSPHQDTSSDATAPAAATSDEAPRSPPRSPRQATVEDEAEAESGWEDVSDNKKAEKPVAEEQPQQQVVKQKADSAKYWLSERSIGEFSRTFTFPSRIDQDGVSAAFKDGILSVFVPKAKKHEARRINIG